MAPYLWLHRRYVLEDMSKVGNAPPPRCHDSCALASDGRVLKSAQHTRCEAAPGAGVQAVLSTERIAP